MGKEWVAFIPITPTIPPAYIVPLSVNPGRKRSSKHITLKAMKQNDNRDSANLYVRLLLHNTQISCHPLLSLPGGGCFVSRSAPTYICCMDQQQQGQQMSMAIGFFPPHWPSPRPTQWDWLSMRHTLTDRGGFTLGLSAASPNHMPHLHWNVIIFPRHREEWGNGKRREKH